MMLKSKIHRAQVTRTDLNYEGSIAIDHRLMAAADILPYEKVEVFNLNNGLRFETYAIEGEPGAISVNGAAARLVAPGDRLIILTFITLPEEKIPSHKPKLVFVNEGNQIKEGIWPG